MYVCTYVRIYMYIYRLFIYIFIYIFIYGQFHQNLLQSRRMPCLLSLLASLSNLVRSHFSFIILVYQNVVFLKWHDLCMLDILHELILGSNEKNVKIINIS